MVNQVGGAGYFAVEELRLLESRVQSLRVKELSEKDARTGRWRISANWWPGSNLKAAGKTEPHSINGGKLVGIRTPSKS